MILKEIAKFTRDLINDSTIDILISRSNYENVDFSKDLILIDNIGGSNQIGNIDQFDGINEIYKFNTYLNGLFTFDFYGDNAYTNVNKFVALLRSQKAYDLAIEYKITPNRATTITDLKQLTGSTNQNRLQVEVKISYYDNVEIETLRIDTLTDELLFNK